MNETVVYDRNSNQILIGEDIRHEFQRQFSLESVTNRPFSFRKGSDEFKGVSNSLFTHRKRSDESQSDSNSLFTNKKDSNEVQRVQNNLFSYRKGSDEYSNFDEEFNTSEESKWKGMMKSHYIEKKDRLKCNGCHRKFSIKLRPRHCRRCGEVFCIKCLQQKTKLNKSAMPDPSGKPRKVCSACYGSSIMIEGCTRSLTEDFIQERTMRRYENILKQRVNSLTTTFWRDQLDVGVECQRLLVGFEGAVANSESKKTLQEIRNLVDTPTWQRSKFWMLESRSTACRACKGSLGIRKHRRNCRVCGLSLCKKCSLRELLVFYPDITDTEETKGSIDRRMLMKLGFLMVKGTTPKLAIINKPGAPTVEPTISMLLHICTECKDLIASKQTHDDVMSLQKDTGGALDKLVTADEQMKELQDRISDGLSKCKMTLESAAVDQLKRNKKETNPLTQNTLDSVDGYLIDYDIQFKALKQTLAAAETKSQTMLVRNYTKGKYDFYMESRQEIRHLRRLRDER